MTISTAFEFYVLADKLLLPPELKVQAFDCIKKIYARDSLNITIHGMSRVLKITPLDCPLRRFILDLACHYNFSTKNEEKANAERSNWLRSCLKECDLFEVVEVFDMFKDTLTESGRLKSLKSTVHRTIVGAQ